MSLLCKLQKWHNTLNALAAAQAGLGDFDAADESQQKAIVRRASRGSLDPRSGSAPRSKRSVRGANSDYAFVVVRIRLAIGLGVQLRVNARTRRHDLLTFLGRPLPFNETRRSR